MQQLMGFGSAINKPKEKIVMLLSAGFSIMKGYPSGKTLNDRISSFLKEEFVFTPNGELLKMNMEKTMTKTNCIHDYNVYEKSYLLLRDIIKHYVENSEETFDYETFYDAIEVNYPKDSNELQTVAFNIWSDEYRGLAEEYITEEISYERLVSNLTIIYDQLIAYFLQGDKKSLFYPNKPCQINEDKNYEQFLKFLYDRSKDSIIDVFTTNHDMVFESFRNIPELSDLISDGFDDYGSEFFGDIEVDGYKYRCRLERYTGKYNAPIRLYKLHGSLDYVLYHKTQGVKCNIGGEKVRLNCSVPVKYVKIKQGMNPYDVSNLVRCQRKYEYSSSAIYCDFLSGTQTKIKRYKNPYLYKKLFGLFAERLRKAGKLIIIGYGCGDTKINEIISNNYKGADKKLYMINPDAENLKEKIHIDGVVIPISKSVNGGILDCKI